MKRMLALCVIAAMLAPAVPAQESPIRADLVTPVVTEGATATGTVSGVYAGQAVNIVWTDPFGDLLMSGTTTGAATGPTPFSFAAAPAYTPYGTVSATTAQGTDTAVLVTVPRRDAFWESFAAVAGAAPEATTQNALSARSVGLTGGMAAGFQGAMRAGAAGMRPIVEGMLPPTALSLSREAGEQVLSSYRSSGETSALTRNPSLADPDVVSRLSAEVASQVAQARTAAPAAYIIAQNPSTGYLDMALDVSFAPADMASFRTWIGMRGAAAAPEGYEGASADTPLPARAMRARVLENPDAPLYIAPWALHREYMDGRLAGAMATLSRAAQTAARRAGPGNVDWAATFGVTGFTGARAPAAYGGSDWTYLAGTTDFAVMAADAPEWAWALARDVFPDARVLARVDAASGNAVSSLWRAASNGMTGAVVDNADRVIAAALAASTPQPGASRPTRGGTALSTPAAPGGAAPAQPAVAPAPTSATAAALYEISAATGSLAARGRKAPTVALIYSPRSVRAGWMLAYLAAGEAAPTRSDAGAAAYAAWPAMMADLGMDFMWVSIDEVARGALLARQIPAAVLPETWCVEAAAADALAQYVTAGGLLIADAGAGLLDGDYAAYTIAPLDRLFGITRGTLTGKRAAEIASAGRTADLAAAADATVIAANVRRARGTEAETGATMVANAAGNGRTLFLNRYVDRYATADKAARAPIIEPLRAAFAAAGILPKVVLYRGSDVAPARVSAFYYGGGRTEVYFIEPLSEMTFVGGEPRVVQVRFRDTGAFYNLRAPAGAQFLGTNAVVTIPAPESGPIVLSRTQAPLSGLQITSEYERPSIYYTVRAVSQDAPGDRLLRVEVYMPQGARAPQFDATVVGRYGIHNGTLTLPQNAPPGVWRIVVRDLETGVMSFVNTVIQ